MSYFVIGLFRDCAGDGIVQLSVSGTIKGFGPGTILGPENEPEDWAWTETMQGSIFKVLSIGVSKFSDEFLLDS